MQYRRLGRTGLAVSPVCLGTMGFGPPTPWEQADRLVRAAADLGVNLIDTANCYDGPARGDVVLGQAETMLGKILDGAFRHDFVLLSKVGVPLREGPQHRGLSATHLLRELDNSLRRLKTDYLDIYMIHWPDQFANVEEVLRAIHQATMAGKIRYFGISNHSAWQVCEYLWMADRRGWPMAAAAELPLNLLDRHYENDLPFYSRHEIGVLAYQPLHGGRLSERRLAPKTTPASGDEGIANWPIDIPAEERHLLSRLNDLATRERIKLSELAIAWTASLEGVSSVVLGARSADQLAAGLTAVNLCLTCEVRGGINAICPGPHKSEPRFAR